MEREKHPIFPQAVKPRPTQNPIYETLSSKRCKKCQTGHANRKQRVLLPETAAGIRFGQRLANENDLALVQFVRMV